MTPLQPTNPYCIFSAVKISDYFFGVPLRLRSSLSSVVVAHRINEAAGSLFWPLSTGVVGGVWSGHLRLRYSSSPFEYNAKPVLSGRVLDATSGSYLELRYRAPVWVYGFYLFWYLFIALFVAMSSAANWAPEITVGDKEMVFFMLGGLAVAPLGLHAVGTRHSDKELNSLLDFLSQQAGAER